MADNDAWAIGDQVIAIGHEIERNGWHESCII
jgi:hypothetical protein